MTDAITIAGIGGWALNVCWELTKQVLGARADELLAPFMDRSRTNHDIQFALQRAWREAASAVCDEYRNHSDEYSRLTLEQREVVRTRTAALLSDDVTESIVTSRIGPPGPDREDRGAAAWYQASRDEASAALRSVLKSAGLWDGSPPAFQMLLDERLLEEFLFRFVEIGIKRSPRARDAVFFDQFIRLGSNVAGVEGELRALSAKVLEATRHLPGFEAWERRTLLRLESKVDHLLLIVDQTMPAAGMHLSGLRDGGAVTNSRKVFTEQVEPLFTETLAIQSDYLKLFDHVQALIDDSSMPVAQVLRAIEERRLGLLPLRQKVSMLATRILADRRSRPRAVQTFLEALCGYFNVASANDCDEWRQIEIRVSTAATTLLDALAEILNRSPSDRRTMSSKVREISWEVEKRWSNLLDAYAEARIDLSS